MDIKYNTTYKLPVLPLRGVVIFPKTLLNFDVVRKKSIESIKEAMRGNQLVFISSQRDPSNKNPLISDLYSMGIVAKIVQVLKQPDEITRVVVEGICRAEIVAYPDDNGVMTAEVHTCCDPDKEEMGAKTVALMRSVKEEFEQYIHIVPKVPSDVIFKVAMCKNGGELCDYIAGNTMLDYQIKQNVLELEDVEERLEYLLKTLDKEIQVLGIQSEICEKAKSNIDENQRKYFLREQLNIIEEELGEDESPFDEAESYAEQIENLHLPEESEEYLIKECKKMAKMPFGSQEASVIRSYLDTVLELPWNVYTNDSIDLEKIRSTLDKNHYGLDKVKKRIIEQLAVKKMNPEAKGQIICLVGPPGVGKTSIAQSVASAINRKSARIALGGVKDEAEIRGHRKTYLGSMPGRIIKAIIQAGSCNPVLILDEIDKLSNDYKGDPTSALLEVLDSEQNNKFCDHYLEIPFDLSNVLFITTANDLSSVPAPLIDRMEVISLDSYTREEKFNIAKKHLIPKQYSQCGINSKIVKFSKIGIYSIIDYYTNEAGVRNLERTIATVMRKCIVNYIDNVYDSVTVTSKNIEEYLGPKKYIDEKLPKTNQIGAVNGLAWTSVGGTLLPIEVAVMPGTGKIELTGSLGDVMKESAKTAISCIRSKSKLLKVDSDFYKNCDIHIHAPEGAVPKDGPSAGITMATAIYSALSSKPVKRDIAMTGEITLRGNVLPIGGLKEKSMAAYKAGAKTVIIPEGNFRDISEFDDVIKSNIQFIPVSRIEQVFNYAFVPSEKTDKVSVDDKMLNAERHLHTKPLRL